MRNPNNRHNYSICVSNCLTALVVSIAFCSCNQQQKPKSLSAYHRDAHRDIYSNKGANNRIKSVKLSDSVLMEQYFQWTERVHYDTTFNDGVSELLALEKNRDTAFLVHFLKENKDKITIGPDQEEFYELNSRLENTFAIDLNGDKLRDIIHYGPSGGEPMIAYIFLNKGDHYEEVFSGYQYITSLNFSGKRLTSFILSNYGCCSSREILNYYYGVNYVGDQPVFRRNKTIGTLSSIEKIQQIAPKMSEFRVQKSAAALRTDCYVLDVDNDFSNIITTYPVGSIGKILGSKRDKTQEWVCVLMAVNNKISSHYAWAFSDQPTAIKGWMLKSDTDLK